MLRVEKYVYCPENLKSAIYVITINKNDDRIRIKKIIGKAEQRSILGQLVLIINIDSIG